tara:strand:- start:2278 stop:3423 length:1146 start_codon:yes stop_codon:yes gene_type:complete
MKKLIFWKFFKDFTLFFIVVSLSISLIIWVIQAVNYLDMVSEDGHTFKIYFLYTLLSLPKIFSKVLPFVFFISLFYMILKYEKNNELIIFWLSGINKSYFVNTIIKFTFFYLIIQFLLTVIIVPHGLNSARTYIKSSDVNVLSSLVRERKFIDSVQNLTIFVEEKSSDGLMKNIFLKEKIGKNKSQIIYAKKGKFDDVNEDFLILFDGEVLNQDTGTISNFSFKETEINLNRFSTQTVTDFKIQENSSKNLVICFVQLMKHKNLITNKIRNESNLQDNCKWDNFDRINQELIKRFILPFYLPILSLIACLIITKSKDEFKFNKFTYLLFLFGISIIIISELSIRYTSENYLNNIFLLSLPILIFLIIYSFFIIKIKVPKTT